jgi:hypothetical protein
MTALWGVSFDATPISGVVVEFVKTAEAFARRGHDVVLDLGYDIKSDKGPFFRPYRDEDALLPDWVRLGRVEGVDRIEGYDREFVAEVLRSVVGRNGGAHLLPDVRRIAGELAALIVAAWQRHDVAFVLVENGTLPENVMYTMALQQAIEEYGRRRRLGRFVLWRDHDLMWQSEPGTGKYGTYPYPATPRPLNSPHVQYLALHEEARRRTVEWAPHITAIDVLPNTFHCRRADDRPVHQGDPAETDRPRAAPAGRDPRGVPVRRGRHRGVARRVRAAHRPGRAARGG